MLNAIKETEPLINFASNVYANVQNKNLATAIMKSSLQK